MKTVISVFTTGTAGLLMRKGLFTGLLLSLVLPSCDDQRYQTVRWVEYEPVYMSQDEFVDAVALEQPRELGEPGKIWFHEGYLFVNEVNEGVHIIDNRDPSSPSSIGFINIPANKDIAVKGNRLYADSHSDLLVFNIENMENAELITRLEDVFTSTAVTHHGFPYQQVDNSRGIVVDWEPVVVEEVCDGNCQSQRISRGGFVDFAAESNGGMRAGDAAPSGSTGGSMARFAITGEYLYAVDDRNLITFDIASPEPDKLHREQVGWSIETIFPHNNSLYIGSESAMYIYNISDPAVPELLSTYWHATACDPVVVEDNFAYVTLRHSERCPQGVNRLDVVDVENLTAPKKVASHEMINPHGLGIDDGYLFISEGEEGLKIMDASDPLDIKQLRHIKNIKTYDVIPFAGVLMVTGESGIVQYSYSDIDNLEHLSTIPITQ